MKHVLLAIMVIFSLAVNSCKKVQKTASIPWFTGDDRNIFDNEIKVFANELNISQLSYAVVDNNGIVCSGNIGNSNENTSYKLGAMTNIFASSILMKLEEEGKLKLKDKMSEFGISDKKFKNLSLKQFLAFIQKNDSSEAYNYDPDILNILEKIFEEKTGKNYSAVLRKKLSSELDMKNTLAAENTIISEGTTSTMADLVNFSIAIDQNTLFENLSSPEQLFRPVYLENGLKMPTSPGWFVQFYNNKKYAWSFGQGKGFSSLIIKSLSDSLSFIVLANSENLNQPFDLHKGDIFRSPLAMDFIKTFLFHNDSIPKYNINDTEDKLTAVLSKINTSPHRNILVLEYLSYLKMSEYLKNDSLTNKLKRLYTKVFPLEMPLELLDRKPIAIIDEVGDYVQLQQSFELKKDSLINIFAVGEFVKEVPGNLFEYDIAEVYFDIFYNRYKNYHDSLHRQYRFNYDFPDTVSGIFSTNRNIKFKQADPDKNSFLFEISFPWSTLNNLKPMMGKKIGFELTMSDCDSIGIKNMIGWHYRKQDQPWINPNVFGTMVLDEKMQVVPNDSICYSFKAKNSISIDGKIDKEWNDAVKYQLNRTNRDSFPKPNDFSASFRSLWDNEYLYLLIEARDNVKFKLPSSGDIAWIENDKKDTVWIMTKNNSVYAGGDATNRFVNTKLKLKKGKYTLNYKTNQSNSYNVWVGSRPQISFYGVAIY